MTYPNWFEMTAKSNFEQLLKEYAGKPNLTFLQIGAFTGDASLWLLENILTDESSLLEDVDTWQGSNEEVHDAMDFNDVYKTYQEKLSKFENVYDLKMTSNEYFLDSLGKEFDFIYIDGDHTASGVIDDAVHAWQVLKPGGIMAFDDYAWQHPDKWQTPRPAIDFFCTAKLKELNVLAVNSQVWIRKNDNTKVA